MFQTCFEFNSPEVLKKAKENVEKFYKVVGVTDIMNITLSVIQSKMPEYFQGAIEEYYQNKDVSSRRNINVYKQNISQEVMAKLTDMFSNEIEFYHYCLQRIKKQFHSIIGLLETFTDFLNAAATSALSSKLRFWVSFIFSLR